MGRRTMAGAKSRAEAESRPTKSRAKAESRLGWPDMVRDFVAGMAGAATLPVATWALRQVPQGDGHAVLVLPGFLSTDQPTFPLRWFLGQAGYRAYPWGLGINLGISTEYEYDIESLVEHRLKEVYIESGDRKISLIGWSLGGVYAKVLARQHAFLIRDVITLGSPISGDPADTSVWRIYEWVSGMDFSDRRFARRIRDATAPLTEVPFTAFFSRDDGVVPFPNACEKAGPLVQNIEVDASHVGMGFDPWVLYLIAHRLAQSARSGWRPLDVDHLRQRFRRQRLPF